MTATDGIVNTTCHMFKSCVQSVCHDEDGVDC